MRGLLASGTAACLAVGLCAAAAGSDAAPPPAHTVSVSGTGITPTSTWPAYDATIERYAVSTTAETEGSLTVTAGTTDAGGVVRVDGRRATGPVTVTGLSAGDEVNVQIEDSAGTSNQSFVYLPADFPTLTASTTGTGLADGAVLLGLGSFFTSRGYEAAVDRHGVPVYVDAVKGNDLKAAPDGYSVARPKGGAYEIVTLDDRFRRTGARQLDGIPDSTDFHDAELLPDGRAVLVGYDFSTHASDGKNYLDAVIQIQDAEGKATWTWNSKDHVDPAEAYVAPGVLFGDYADYAHVNSVQLVGGHEDVLASFRNLSQVRLIATEAHDGYRAGDTIWTFGGAVNDFSIVDGDGHPDGGPCAQHMARLLPDGHLTLFDNGSLDQGDVLGGQTADMCADPGDPTGPRIARPHTRVTEYALDLADPAHPLATLVWEFAPDHRYAAFAGSQQRLANGNTLVGWSASSDPDGTGAPQPVASEVSPAGQEVWSLSAPGWFTYRAAQALVADETPPVVTLTGLTDGATLEPDAYAPTVSYGCTDRGGSNLDACTGTVPDGGAVPMTPGQHTVTVTATDRAGNTGTATVGYTVTAPPGPPAPPSPSATPTAVPAPAPTPTWRPVGAIRRHGGAWRPRSVHVRLRADDRATVLVRVRNGGDAADRFEITAPSGGKRFVVSAERRGRLTPVLAPGATYVLRLVLARTPKAEAGDTRRLRVVVVSRHDADARDAVVARLIAR